MADTNPPNRKKYFQKNVGGYTNFFLIFTFLSPQDNGLGEPFSHGKATGYLLHILCPSPVHPCTPEHLLYHHQKHHLPPHISPVLSIQSLPCIRPSISQNSLSWPIDFVYIHPPAGSRICFYHHYLWILHSSGEESCSYQSSTLL